MRVANGAESQLTATPEAEPKEDGPKEEVGPKEKVEKPWRKWAKKVVAVVIVVLALWGAYEHRSEISSAGGMLSQLKVAWLLVAIVAELASMVVFARLQRWLLRAGGVQVPFVPMVEITLAGNAMSTTLPGGAAWSATWVFEQLHRRGAQKVLAGWVILVAGAFSSFAVFVILAVGAWVAGSRGPVSSLRWLAAGLAAIPLLVTAGYVLARRSNRVRQLMSSSWNAISRRLPPARALGNLVHKTVVDLGLVHPGFLGWAEVVRPGHGQLALRLLVLARLHRGPRRAGPLARDPGDLWPHPGRRQPSYNAGRDRCRGGLNDGAAHRVRSAPNVGRGRGPSLPDH